MSFSRNQAPSVNAGSMADIAFLLLIFFLVTTTLETDQGISRLLPSSDTQVPTPKAERNILRISLNAQDAIMVGNQVVTLEEVPGLVMSFLDNGGKDSCSYCQGQGLNALSDSPKAAVVSLSSASQSSYAQYIAIQDALSIAYTELRDREGLRLYQESFSSMKERWASPEVTAEEKQQLTQKLKQLQNLFPQQIVESKLDPQNQAS
ncbi:ExbD/TolR family protein [Aureicoccus marinus]|jgi:hypothetical protein|uniref:Biopolymer transporter ExbD n=1 Tax=Aureicoccus marinus TaxID=754435 RepID=A0A2S7T7H4_9FLAO|nr:biopolymer transporter ExbD [Aureicoccus marinus]PQJ15879.1 hypothetical protein BST99_09215 [Aureicoccus marinus]